jgi:hypothetical protein
MVYFTVFNPTPNEKKYPGNYRYHSGNDGTH